LAVSGFTREGWWLTLAIAVIMLFIAKNIQRTTTGRKFVAVRDNDLAAEVMGINLFRTKLLSFFIGCFFAGIAGWLWAHCLRTITPDLFTFSLPVPGHDHRRGMGTSGRLGAAIMLVDKAGPSCRTCGSCHRSYQVSSV
jgi:hypothetical protein